MVLNDKVYNVLKWLGLVVMPAIAVLVKAVFPVWGLPYADAIATTSSAIGLFIGTIIGVSQMNLKPELDAEPEFIDEAEEVESEDTEAKG